MKKMNQKRMRFLCRVLPVFAGCLILGISGCGSKNKQTIRFGIVTDVHYADRETAGTRHYHNSMGKLEQAIAEFNGTQLDFVIELGDFIDKGATVSQEMAFMEKIDSVYQTVNVPRYYVLGNHDVATFSKKQFLQAAGYSESYYTFHQNGFQIIVLDACFRADGVAYDAGNYDWKDSILSIPQIEWLAENLYSGNQPVVVFIHQRLDAEMASTGVKNAKDVRHVLEASGRVKAVFQGHHHPGHQAVINNIPYFTLSAMIEGPFPENNAYSIAEVTAGGKITINGFGNQPDRHYSEGK